MEWGKIQVTFGINFSWQVLTANVSYVRNNSLWNKKQTLSVRRKQFLCQTWIYKQNYDVW